MEAVPQSQRLAQLVAVLRRRHIRVTAPRLAVLGALCRATRPLSHPQLAQQLAGDQLDQATVYRNLVFLAEQGLVVRVQLGDAARRFALPSTDHVADGAHPHFVCDACGDVACLPRAAVALCGAAMRARVAEVQLRGQCEACDGRP